MKKYYVVLNNNTNEYVADRDKVVTSDIDKALKWNSEEGAVQYLEDIWRPNMSGVYFFVIPVWIKH